MPYSTKLLDALEHRMRDFIESRGAKDARPIALLLSDGIQQDVKRILMQRLMMIELQSPEHSSDAHKMESCSVCRDIFGYLKYKFEGPALEFISMNRDLFAEIELSH